MATDQSLVIKDHVLNQPVLELNLKQIPNSITFVTCVLSFFGIQRISLNHPGKGRFNRCRFTFDMDSCPEHAVEHLDKTA